MSIRTEIFTVMSKFRNYKAAQYIFFAFLVSNLCLATGVIVYSSFLAWVYSDDARRASYNFDTSQKPYIVAYALISTFACVLFTTSFIILIVFLFSKTLYTRLNIAYLYASIVILVGVFLTPLVVMAVMNRSDG